MSDDDEHAAAALRKAVRRAAGAEALGFEQTTKNLVNVSRVVREELAAILQPALNAQAAAMPHTTYEEKKALANWVNQQLRPLGLTIRCPRTGQPCLLQASTGRNPTTGYFRLDYMDEAGHRHNPSSSVSVPALELMPDPQTHTPFRTRNSRSR